MLGTYSYEDEWLLENETLSAFIDHVNAVRRSAGSPEEAVEAIRPHFAHLLADPDWLPARFQELAPTESGMGGKIGMWLLYRAGDGGLAFSVLVLPPGAQTPVHDHLAWGLVGLYRGEQDEEIFAPVVETEEEHQDHAAYDYTKLELHQRQPLKPGDFYALTPDNDIHRVRTTSAVTSVSLHLLGNDNGCIWRHRFDPDAATVAPFRSGWLNTECRTYED